MDALIFLATFAVTYLVIFVPLYRWEMRSHDKKVADMWAQHRKDMDAINTGTYKGKS